MAIDEKAAKKSGKPNDRSLESKEFGMDAWRLKVFLTDDKEKEENSIDNGACKESNTRRVYTALKGCWCEKT